MAELKTITIVGCGPGGAGYLTGAARDAVAGADCLIGSARLLSLFPDTGKEKINVGADVQRALDAIEQRGNAKVAVLVSGDPGLCSLAAPVLKKYGIARCDVVPGISSAQYAFAKVGEDWRDARIISAHAEEPDVDFSRSERKGPVAILAGTDAAIKWIAGLAPVLGDGWRLVVCENLSLPDEKITEMGFGELAHYRASSLTVALLIEKGEI